MNELLTWIDAEMKRKRTEMATAYAEIARVAEVEARGIASGIISTPETTRINNSLQRASEASVRFWALVEVRRQIKSITGVTA